MRLYLADHRLRRGRLRFYLKSLSICTIYALGTAQCNPQLPWPLLNKKS